MEVGYKPAPQHYQVATNQTHWKRRSEILQKYPEVKKLYGKEPTTAFYTVVLVTILYTLTYFVGVASEWDWCKDHRYLFFAGIFALVYCVGAVIDHALWTLIHDLGHGLAFDVDWLNSFFMCIANMPHFFPSASTFTFYHKLHHTHLNEAYADPDLPSPWEEKLFGTTTVGKMVWLGVFFLLQPLRVLRGPLMPISLELIFNYVTSIAATAMVMIYCGKFGFMFYLLSSVFAIGLHPLGGRWIAEHYNVYPNQETYSYYGIGNLVAFNVGFHNEHHDFPSAIPWSRLPKLTKIAKEYYEPLYKHYSYSALLYNFFFDPNFTLTTRVIRKNRNLGETEENKLMEGTSNGDN